MSSMRVIYRRLSLTKTSKPLPVTMPRRKAAQRATTIGPSTIDIDLMNTPFCRVSASRPRVFLELPDISSMVLAHKAGDRPQRSFRRVRRPQRASRSRRRWLRGSPTRLSKDVPDHWRAPFDFISFKAWISCAVGFEARQRGSPKMSLIIGELRLTSSHSRPGFRGAGHTTPYLRSTPPMSVRSSTSISSPGSSSFS
jgi:hypothetical protein